jgi:hypothetical protein
MRAERITPEASRGKGWARVPFKDCEAPSELASMAIVRPRHMEQYLGRKGWQISESRLPLIIEAGESEFDLLLEPAVVQHLEVASNYEFWFYNRSVQLIHHIVVRWAGVSYRAPIGKESPIEVIQPDDLPPVQPIFGYDGTANRFETPAHPDNVGSRTAVTGFGSAWATAADPGVAPSKVEAPSQPAEVIFTTSSTSLTPPEPQPSRALNRAAATRVRCGNQNCGYEILDSMKWCPICGEKQ